MLRLQHMSTETFGGRLRCARELSGLSQVELSDLAGVYRDACRRFEKMELPGGNLETVVAFADVLGIDLHWLCTGIGPAPEADAIQRAVDVARARMEAA